MRCLFIAILLIAFVAYCIYELTKDYYYDH